MSPQQQARVMSHIIVVGVRTMSKSKRQKGIEGGVIPYWPAPFDHSWSLIVVTTLLANLTRLKVDYPNVKVIAADIGIEVLFAN